MAAVDVHTSDTAQKPHPPPGNKQLDRDARLGCSVGVPASAQDSHTAADLQAAGLGVTHFKLWLFYQEQTAKSQQKTGFFSKYGTPGGVDFPWVFLGRRFNFDPEYFGRPH
jgi:hypothetical protein